jgi:hypothetical protein
MKNSALKVIYFANLDEPFFGYWVPLLIAVRSEINNKCDCKNSIGFFSGLKEPVHDHI